MENIFIWTIIYCICNTLSIVLIGDRSLISGNLLQLQNAMGLLLSWKFILAMVAAVFTRLSFVMLNNSLLKIPKLAQASTTICIFITLISLIFVVIANYIFLDERFSLNQILGALIIMIGVLFMFR